METNDARTLLKKIQTPIQRRISKCGLFGMIFGLLLLIIGLILLLVILFSPETLNTPETKKCFFMIKHFNHTSIDKYIDRRLKSIIIKITEDRLNNTKYYNDELKPYVQNMQKADILVYISVEPKSIEILNNKFSDITWDGIVIDNSYIKNDVKSVINVFNHINEYKIKRNSLFHSILMTEFGTMIDRYYFDTGMYVTHSKNKTEMSQKFTSELRKGDGLIGLYLKEYGNDLNKIFEVANYIENNHMTNTHFFGYVIIFDD